MSREKIKSFTDLNAWKKGHGLVLDIYKITKDFPNEEMYGLVSQMRRCAVSITLNIAEGFGRKSYKEKNRFYYISRGSVAELQNQLLVSRDIKYIDNKIFQIIGNKTVEVNKIISGLIKKSKNIAYNC